MDSVAGLTGIKFGRSVKDLAGDVVLTTPSNAAPTIVDRADIAGTEKPRPAPQQPAAQTAVTPATATNPAQPKKWTFLFYINGNNFLAKQAPSQLRMLEFAGSDDNINIAAQVARQKGTLDMITRDWSGVRRYEVPETDKELSQGELIGEIFRQLVPPYTRGIKSEMKQDLGEADMANPRTLSDFVKWGMNKYPAEHYCVVMLGPSQGMNGIMKDDTSGKQMSPQQLASALATVEKDTGKKVDVLAFDASNSTQIELLHEIKDHVNYVVGSEGLVAGAGMSVPSVVYELKKSNLDVVRTPEEVAQTFTMVGSMAVSAQGFAPTISAVDMSKVGAIKDSINDLGEALLKAKIDKAHLRELMANTQEVAMPGVTRAYEGVRDVFHFAKLISRDKDITDAAVKTAAQKVMDSVEGAMVGEAHRGGPYRNANGISMFLPDNYGFIRPDSFPVDNKWDHKFGYEKLSFNQNNSWSKFLESVSEDSFSGGMANKVLGQKTVDGLVGFKRSLDPTVRSYSGWASTIGWWESFNVLQSGRPGRFLFLPATAAAYVGAYGGLYDMYNGVKAATAQFKDSKSYDAIIYNGLDVIGGAAKAAACVALVQPQLVPFAYAAGIFGFAKPWIKNAYEYFMQYKAIRDSIALNEGTKGDAAVLAVQQMIGKNQVWDK